MSIVQSIVLEWFGSWEQFVRIIGWLPCLLFLSAMGGIFKSQLATKLVQGLGIATILWGIASLFYVLGSFLAYQLWPSLRAISQDYPRLLWPLDLLAGIYALLNRMLAPATGFLLLFTPFLAAVALPDSKALGTKMPEKLLGLWAFIAGTIIAFIAAEGLFANLSTLLLYGGAAVGLIGFDMTQMNTMRSRYGSESVFRGFKVRRRGEYEGKDKGPIIRIGLLVAVTAAFWFHLTLSETVLIAFYSTAIGGLLAIIGFAALVFTFAYEAIPTMKLRREVAADTRFVQQASTIVIVASIFGLVLTGGSLTLNAAEASFMDSLRGGIMICAFAGLLIATDTVMTLFRLVATALADFGNSATVATVYFDESRTPDGNSATSEDGTGLSEMRNYLEDRGCNVLPLASAPFEALAATQRLILVMPRATQAFGDDLYGGYSRVVEDGNVLLVLTDPEDWAHKAGLAKHFGFQDPISLDNDSLLSVQLASSPNRPIASLRSPLMFPANNGSKVVLETVPGQIQNSDQLAVGIARRYGRGWVVIVSSISTFENNQLKSTRDFRLVHSLLEHLVDLFPSDRAATKKRTAQPVKKLELH